jgi:hypothetical protein
MEGRKATQTTSPDPGGEHHAPIKGGRSTPAASRRLSSAARRDALSGGNEVGVSSFAKRPAPNAGCRSRAESWRRQVLAPVRALTAPGSQGNSAVRPPAPALVKIPRPFRKRAASRKSPLFQGEGPALCRRSGGIGLPEASPIMHHAGHVCEHGGSEHGDMKTCCLLGFALVNGNSRVKPRPTPVDYQSAQRRVHVERAY